MGGRSVTVHCPCSASRHEGGAAGLVRDRSVMLNRTFPGRTPGNRRRGARRSMYDPSRALETAVWAAAEGTATADQLALLEADPRAWRLTLERLLDETEDDLDSVRQLDRGPSGTRWSPTSRRSWLASRRPTTC